MIAEADATPQLLTKFVGTGGEDGTVPAPRDVPAAADERAPAHAAEAEVEAEQEVQAMVRGVADAAGTKQADAPPMLSAADADANDRPDWDLPAMLPRVVQAARDLVGARYAALGVIGSDGRLEQFIHAGIDDDLAAEIGSPPGGVGVLGLLLSDPRPLRLTDIAEHPASVGFPPHHPTMRSFLGVPVLVNDAPYGMLYLADRVGGGDFTEDDEKRALAFAVSASRVIGHSMLFAEAEQRRKWRAASATLMHRLLSDDGQPPLELITREAASAADADFVSLTTPEGPDSVVVRASGGRLAGDLTGSVWPLAGTLSERVLHDRTPLLVSDYRSAVPSPAFDLGPVMVLPLVTRDQVRGVIALSRSADRRAFTTTDLELATEFAHQATFALELVQSRADQLRLSVLEAQDRIARDLHDHVIQALFATGMGLESIINRVDTPDLRHRLANHVNALDDVITQIRATIYQIQLPGADHTAIKARILTLIDEHADALGFHPAVRFHGLLNVTIDSALADDLLAVLREAMSNCNRHARATRMSIVLTYANGELSVEVSDNGVGLGIPTRRSGLGNMQRRAEQHGGTFTATSAGNGQVTRLLWTAVNTLTTTATAPVI